MIAALGLASRPTRSRSAVTKAWLMVSNRPLSRQAANQRYTVGQGGRSVGISRQGMPPRRIEGRHQGGVDDLSKGPVGRPPQLSGPGHMRLDDSPFGIGQVGFVTESRAAILLAGGRGPHEVLQEASATPWNPIDS